MRHQIPSHLAFCTPGKNQKAKQGTNPETLKRNNRHNNNYIILNESQGMKRMGNMINRFKHRFTISEISGHYT